MAKKKLITIALLAGIAIAAAAFLIVRRTALAQGTDLLSALPGGADVYTFVDMESLESNPIIQKLFTTPPGFPHDEEYERFLKATGFRYEQDLRRVAIAKMGQDWAGMARVHIDRARVEQYMESQGAVKQEQSGRTIFSFGGIRAFRLAFLDNDPAETLAVFTAGGDDAEIRRMLERHAGKRSDSAASEFTSGNRSGHIPPESKVWLMGKPAKLLGTDGADAQVGSFSLGNGFLRGSEMIYASVDPSEGQLKFRIEDYCDSPASAQRIGGALQGLLALAKSLPSGKGKNTSKGAAAQGDPNALLAGISIEQQQQSVLLRWQWGEDALKFLQTNSH